MSEKKQYTFEDWKHGRITADLQKGKIKKISSVKSGHLPYELYSNDFLSKEEYLKIKKAQKKAFKTAVDITVNTIAKQFEQKLSKALAPNELLKAKISELHETLDKAQKHELETVWAGKPNLTGIDWYKYILIEHPMALRAKGVIKENPTIIHLGNPSAIPDAGKRSRSMENFTKTIVGALKPTLSNFDVEIPDEFQSIDFPKFNYNRIYDLTVIWYFLERIKNLKSEKQKKKVQSSYGTHQKNREWIEKNFQEQRPKHKSQNKAALKVKELYKEKFGLKISTNTILRAVGLVE